MKPPSAGELETVAKLAYIEQLIIICQDQGSIWHKTAASILADLNAAIGSERYTPHRTTIRAKACKQGAHAYTQLMAIKSPNATMDMHFIIYCAILEIFTKWRLDATRRGYTLPREWAAFWSKWGARINRKLNDQNDRAELKGASELLKHSSDFSLYGVA